MSTLVYFAPLVNGQEDNQSRTERRGAARQRKKIMTEVVKNEGRTIPTRDAVRTFLQIAALFLTVFVLLPWACGCCGDNSGKDCIGDD